MPEKFQAPRTVPGGRTSTGGLAAGGAGTIGAAGGAGMIGAAGGAGMIGAAGGAETIGAVIARVRTAKGVTQLRLAERLCAAAGVATVTRHEVSRWEREERLPSGFWLGWLAFVLDLRVDHLESAVAAARQRRGQLGPAAAAARQRRGQIDHAGPRPRWQEVGPGVYSSRAS